MRTITTEQAEQIAAMLRAGAPQSAIMTALPGVTRQNIRTARIRHGITPPDRSDAATYDSIAAKWHTHLQADGDHMRWTGPTTNGTTPCMWWGRRTLSARAIAFELRTGRPPVGRVQAECEEPWCVAPAHVEDQPGRDRLRAQLGALTGIGARAATVCGRGHDQTVHGTRTANLRPYCRACRTHIDRERREETAQ
jgi:hypothetical protein